MVHLTDRGFELQLVPPWHSAKSNKERKYNISLDFLDPDKASDLVYREAPYIDSLVLASLEDKMFLDQLHEAIGAETWMEFEYLIPDAELAELIGRHN